MIVKTGLRRFVGPSHGTLNWRSAPNSLLPAGFSLTRASANATSFDSTGTLVTSAANVARGTYRYNGTSWVFDGTIIEAAATNLATDVRDMTTVNWTRGATITVAQTGIGADGSANACSRLTGGAVAATNRVSQTLVAAASTRTYGPLIRRVTGTGPILITQDGFATTTDVSSQINSSGFTEVQISGSTLNATYGVQVSTNGDVILVDGNQFEAGSSKTSTILTGGATRAADVLTAPTSGLLVNAQGFAAIGYRTIAGGATAAQLSTWTGSGSMLVTTNATTAFIFDGTALAQVAATPQVPGEIEKIASTWLAGSHVQIACNGTVGAQSALAGNLSNGATIRIGNHVSTLSEPISMVLQSLRLGTKPVTAGQLAQLSR